MTLNTFRLLMFFMAKYLAMKPERRKYWFSDAPSDEEVEERLEHIAGMVRLLLGNGGIGRHEVEDIIWLISEYCHRELDIPPRLDIAHHLAQCARSEPALHVLKRYYRDHFFHALDVCLIGHFLLEVEIEVDRALWKIVAEKLGCESDQKTVLGLWYLTSLLHDIGYGIDALEGVKELLDFFKNARPLKELGENIEKAVEKLSKEQEKDGFGGYDVKDKTGEDHGVVGARHFHGLVKRIAEGVPQVKTEDYEEVMWAIALHNHRKHVVKFEEHPLGFLLIICDTLQEWNRIQLNFATAPAQILAKLQEYGVSEEDLTGPLKNINVNTKYVGGCFKLASSKGTGKGRKRLCFRLEYDEGIQKNAGVFDLWIDASCDFQRLDFTGLDDIDIDVEYITPAYKDEKGKRERQLYRLRDAARETHMGFLEKWFPTEKKGDGVWNGAVEYWCEDGPSGEPVEEHLVLHLRELSKKKLITKGIGEFRERLKKWKRYNEDRDFSGDYAPAVPD